MTSYWCCGQPPSTLFGRVVSQMTMMFPFALELVFSGPFSADVNAHHRIFGLLVVLQSRASQSVIDSLCLCVQLLKASRGGITLFWQTILWGTANITRVVLVVSFTTIVASKKSWTSSGRSMWFSVSFSPLFATQWTGVLLAFHQVGFRKFHMDNIIREIVTLVSLLSLNNSFGDLLATKLSRTFLTALVWSVSSQIVLVLCASLGDDT